MQALIGDFQYAIRRLVRSPGFAAVAVVSLALGIGANTAIFSIVNAVLLRDGPGRAPERLVELYMGERSGFEYSTFSEPDYRDVRDAATVFDGVGARYAMMLGMANADGSSDMLWGEVVSSNLFDVLGVDAALGRAFHEAMEGEDGAAPTALISHGLWNRRFAADPGVVGETLRLNGRQVTVVGVMPPEFTGQFPGLAMDVWVPMEQAVWLRVADPEAPETRSYRQLFPVARLADGVSLEQARAELATIGQRLAMEYPETNDGRGMTLVPATDVSFNPLVDRGLVPVAVLLMVVVGLVLAIACANLANLLLVRAAGRHREIATRLAVGAGRGTLIRQLLTESVVLAVLGGAVGLALAWVVVRAIMGLTPPIPMTLNLQLGLDGTVLAFTLGISVATGLLFGLAPALRASRPDLITALKDPTSADLDARKRFGLRNLLVTGQLVMSVLLLVTAGLFVRSLSETQKVDAGFDTERIAVAAFNLGQFGYDGDEGTLFMDRLVERLEGRADVRSAAVAGRIPLGLGIHTGRFHVEGTPMPADPGDLPNYDFVKVDHGYFETMAVPVVWGRAFEPTDRTGPPVAIVSETAARRLWPGEDPIGRRIRRGAEGEWMEVVGVARDTKVRMLSEAPRPYVYLPTRDEGTDFALVVVATRGAPGPFVRTLLEEVRAMDPAVTPFDSGSIQEQTAIMLYPARMGAILLAAFGGLALLLAITGLYGVISYTVSRRTREVGIRMAMGAERKDISGMVLKDGARFVAAGLGIGLALALVLSQLLGGFLYGISVTDPVTFVAIPVILAAVAMLASMAAGSPGGEAGSHAGAALRVRGRAGRG